MASLDEMMGKAPKKAKATPALHPAPASELPPKVEQAPKTREALIAALNQQADPPDVPDVEGVNQPENEPFFAPAEEMQVHIQEPNKRVILKPQVRALAVPAAYRKEPNLETGEGISTKTLQEMARGREVLAARNGR